MGRALKQLGASGENWDVFYSRNRAGRSAHRQHKALTRAWRDRVLGHRTGLLVWSLLLLAALLLQHVPLSEQWAFVAGSLIGGIAVGWLLLPETVMPGWIGNWQLGGWGEENTASELKRLKKIGWTVRHDLATSGKANVDHLVVGSAAYVLDTKNLKDNSISVEGDALRITRIDNPEWSYLLDRFPVKRQAERLERTLMRVLGFPVHVQPVLVVWGDFKEEEAWLGSLAVIQGLSLATWLENQQPTLAQEDKRQALATWAKRLRSA